MSDPFEVLRNTPGDRAEPPLDAIRSRARRIQRRRQVGLASSAVVVLVVALIGVMLNTGPSKDANRNLAQGRVRSTSAPAKEADTALSSEAQRKDGLAQSAGGSASTAGTARHSAPASGRATSDAAAPYAAAAPPQGPLNVTVEVNDKSLGPRRGVGLTLRACNPGSSAVSRDFGSGQRYDFEVSRGGSLVWRWSDGRAFTQEYGTVSWGAKECKTWSEWWDGTDRSGKPATAGTYDVVGILASTSRQRSTPKSFCLDVC